MSNDLVPVRRDDPPSNGLHPYVYAALAGLVFWFVLSAWEGFAGDSYANWLLVVISGFLLILSAIPFVLSRVSRDDDDGSQCRSFRSWASGDFETWQYRLNSKHAAAEVLLPVAAIAFGMTAFGIVALLVSHGTV